MNTTQHAGTYQYRMATTSTTCTMVIGTLRTATIGTITDQPAAGGDR
ncbi:hypothetical protein [Actinocorallia aurea]